MFNLESMIYHCILKTVLNKTVCQPILLSIFYGIIDIAIIVIYFNISIQ